MPRSGRLPVPVDAVLRVRSEGSGTFDNPAITLNATVAGGTFKGRELGSGTISATLRNKDISANAALFNEKMRVKGQGLLNDNCPGAQNFMYGRAGMILLSVLF